MMHRKINIKHPPLNAPSLIKTKFWDFGATTLSTNAPNKTTISLTQAEYIGKIAWSGFYGTKKSSELHRATNTPP